MMFFGAVLAAVAQPSELNRGCGRDGFVFIFGGITLSRLETHCEQSPSWGQEEGKAGRRKHVFCSKHSYRFLLPK